MLLSARRPFVRAALGICLFAGVGITSCGGGSSKRTLAHLAATCTINSDCSSPLVCAFQRCHEACTETRDCTSPSLCVLAGDVNICQLPEEITCKTTAECAGKQVCSPDKLCRDACTASSECVDTQSCVRGYCGDVLDGGTSDGSGGVGGTSGGGASGGPFGGKTSSGGSPSGGASGVDGSVESDAGLDKDGCPKDRKNCERVSPDCETPVDTVVACGGCDVHCDAVNGTPICENLKCVVPPGACTTGYGDCDGDGRNGCEQSLTDDPKNCGTCHRVCEGGTPCVNGSCAVVTVVTPSSGPAVNVIAQPAFTKTEVYFLRSDGVHHAPLAPSTLPASSTVIASTNPAALTVDSQYVYWTRGTSPGSLRRYALNGTGQVEAVNDALGVFGSNSTIRADATSLVFSYGEIGSGGTVQQLAKGSLGASTPIVSGRPIVYQVAINSKYLVWQENSTKSDGCVDSIFAAPRQGGTGTAIRSLGDYYACGSGWVTNDERYFYWVDRGASDNTGKVRRYDLTNATATPEDVVFDLNRPWGVLVDDAYIYYGNYDSDGPVLYRKSKTGSALPERMTRFSQYLVHVDDKYVWGMDEGNNFVRTPK